MKKFFYLVLVLALGAALYVLLSEKPIRADVATVIKDDFVETLSYEGKIRAKNRKTLFATASGQLEGFSLQPGDFVKAGQVITQLNWDRPEKLRAPIGGVVSKVFRNSPGPVVRGEPIIEISDIAALEVVVDLLTTDAVRLQEGGDVQVLRWGGDGELRAKIQTISKAAQVKVSALGVDEQRTEVKINLDNLPKEVREKIGDNYHVDVIFMVSKSESVLILPLGALFKSGDQWAVFAVQEDRARLHPVTFTKRNEKSALITEGLSEGQQVVLFPSDKIRDGVVIEAMISK